jgi:hypothetical protein
MLIQHNARIPFPVTDVYNAFLLRMDELPPWLPGIQRIDITRFETPAEHRASIDYKWHIHNAIVPPLLRPFLRSNMDHIRSTTTWCAQAAFGGIRVLPRRLPRTVRLPWHVLAR